MIAWLQLSLLLCFCNFHFLQKQKSNDVFRKLFNTDFVNLHDYPCDGSLVLWACVIAVKTEQNALHRCRADPHCKALVSVPHPSVAGRYTHVFILASRTE